MKYLPFVIIIVLALVGFTLSARAATILFPTGGGTGSTTLTGILKGNGTSPVQSAVGNTDYQLPISLTTTGSSGAATFNGTTLNIPQYSGGGSSFPFTPQSWGNSTSTTIGFTNGIISNASSTFSATTTFSNGLNVGTGYGLQFTGYSALPQVFAADTSTGLHFDGPGIVSFHNGGIQTMLLSSTNKVGIGTTSPGSLLSVQGNGLFSGNLSTANLTATGTITFSGLSNGLVKSTSGVLSAATAGTDYENPLTFSYPLTRSSNTISLAFGTTTANSWSALQTFSAGASTTMITATGGLYLASGSDYLIRTSGANLDFAIPNSSAGYFRFRDGTSGTIHMVIDESNSHVGIGSTTPYAKLSVRGDGTGSGVNFQTTNSSDSPIFTILDSGAMTHSGSFTQYGDTTLYPGSGNTTRALGITSGTYDGIANVARFRNGGSSFGGFAFSFFDGPPSLFLQNATGKYNAGIGTSSPYAKLSIQARDGDLNTTLFAIGSSTASATTTLFSVLNNGYVGVGNSAPTQLIDVYGLTASSPRILVRNDGTYNVNLGIDASNVGYIGSTNATPISFKTDGINRLYIQNTAAGGNIGIGTTTPSQRLSVQGNGLFSGNLSVAGLTATGTISLPNNSITNAMLANSSITVSNGGGLTVSGSPVSLGGTLTLSLNVGNNNSWTGRQNFANASSSLSSFTGTTWFGGTATSTFNSLGQLSIGTSTSPWSTLTLDRGNNGIASSSITVTQYSPATSTAMTIDCRDSNTVFVSLGTGATTITLAPMVGGQSCMVAVMNPNGTPGAITWSTTASQKLWWANGGTAPTPTATANKTDLYSFKGITYPAVATSTPQTIINGAATQNFGP